MSRTATLTRVMVIRPGATDFDDQGRMKGSLDMPLSERGEQQVETLAAALADIPFKTIYCCPSESARATADRLSEAHDVKVKVVDAFKNVDHGLWHGKLIEEVRRNHPRVYRQGIDHAEEFCAPGGEGLMEAKARVLKALNKCVRKGRDEIVALVIPEPMASVVTSLLNGQPIEDLWRRETDSASWELIDTEI
ncbi:histidine phosphatase family protein [Stieleria varia]|uniref:Phosphoserine phosphatase 1 n=1 Tax=Stieleria varia TaxID=2528005 RepID=A0A5C6B7M7_9BACT|nr:histidine phosphatase family protein [Stieleria varia]TWU08265.1 Phosphoserine phosphatase 1 [Stieleria varia]